MKARWLTDKYISLMLLVFPLWTGTEGYAAITRGKFLFFAVLSALYLALLLPCALLGLLRRLYLTGSFICSPGLG